MSKQMAVRTLKLLHSWRTDKDARQWTLEPRARRARRSVRDRRARCARDAAPGTTRSERAGACVQRAQRETISGEGVQW